MDDEIKLPEIKFDIQKDRYKYFGEYKVDRWIITSCMLLVFGYLFFIAYHYDFKMNYYNCERPEMGKQTCLNPFYKAATWENAEYLPPGEYGTKLGPLFNSAWYVTIGLFILGFGLNHYIYNRKRKEGLL